MGRDESYTRGLIETFKADLNGAREEAHNGQWSVAAPAYEHAAEDLARLESEVLAGNIPLDHAQTVAAMHADLTKAYQEMIRMKLGERMK
jgi:hypothetical protein